MNRTRNIAIAVILFVCLALFIYSFASEAGDKKDKEDENAVVERQKVTDATDAVEKAEETKEQVDIDAARELINALSPSDKKEELERRLDTVIDLKDASNIGLYLTKNTSNLAFSVTLTANVVTERTDLIDNITYGSGNSCPGNTWGTFNDTNRSFNVTTNGNYVVCLTTTNGITKTAYVYVNNIIKPEDVTYTYDFTVGKTVYQLGDNFDLSNYKFIAIPTVGSNINITDLKVTGFDNTVLGTQTVKISGTHKGKALEKSVTITVNNKIDPTASEDYTYVGPTKNTYVVGDLIDITDSTLTINLVTGPETITVTEGMFSDFSTEVPGEHEFNFVYQYNKDGVVLDIKVPYNVTIENKLADDREEDYTFKAPDKFSYFIGEENDLTGGTITINLATGPEVIELTESMISGFELTTLEDLLITVNYTYDKDGVTLDIEEHYVIQVTNYRYTAPIKEVYEMEEEFDGTGSNIEINTSEGIVNILVDLTMIPDFDSTIPGSYMYDVIYDYDDNGTIIEIRDVYVVTINNKLDENAESPYEFNIPTKTDYLVDEAIDLTDGSFVINLITGPETIALTSDMIVDTVIDEETGQVTLYFNYVYDELGVRLYLDGSYTITVSDYDLSGEDNIFITLPTKVEYDLGEEIDLTDGVINVNTAAGNINTYAITEDMISGIYDKDTAGTYNLTITYEDVSIEFIITVKE